MTSRVRTKFLETLRKTGNVTEAARVARISRNTVYTHRHADPVFAEAWDDAEEEATDALEYEARRRAVHGVERPVVYKGEVVATIPEYSDRLMELLLKAHRPEKFKERVANELTGKGGGPIDVVETPASQRLKDALTPLTPPTDAD